MARLRAVDRELRVQLRPSHVVGRGARSDLVIPDDLVSKAHARFEWTGQNWLLRDMGSTNGTTVDGVALDRIAVPLRQGAIVRFGDARHTWIVEDVSPPSASAVDDDGVETTGSPSFLALGPADSPVAFLTRLGSTWELEDVATGAVRTVRPGERVELAGCRWTVHLPETESRTRPAGPRLDDVRLRFRVSRDEEHVELEAHGPGGVIDLGAHAFHYLLLELARERLSSPDPLDAEAGWVYQDDLLRRFRWRPERLNVAVFRAREKVELAGIADAERIVERRNDTRQLRIGVADVDVVRN